MNKHIDKKRIIYVILLCRLLWCHRKNFILF